MNPLFPHFERQIQEAARAEFAATQLGKILLRKNHTPSEIRQIAGLVKRYARGKGPSGFEAAKKAMYDLLVDQILGKMGAFGKLFEPLLRPAGEPLVKDLDRELTAAANLLRAFGYGVTEPEEIESAPGVPSQRRPGQPSPAAEGSPTGVRPFNAMPRPEPELPGPRVLPPLAGNSRSRTWQDNRVRVTVGGQPYSISPDDPMLTGEMIPVTSSNVHSIGFIWNHENKTAGVLKVRFRARAQNGGPRPTSGGPLYHYYGVNPAVFKAFQLAASKGKFVWDKLRVRGTVSGHQYHYQLMGIEKDGYVPRKATRIGPNEYFLRRQVQGKNGKTYRSHLQDELVQRWQPGAPNRGRPNRGTPNRGRP